MERADAEERMDLCGGDSDDESDEHAESSDGDDE